MRREQVIAEVADIAANRRLRGDQAKLDAVRARFDGTPEAAMAEVLLLACIFMVEELDAVEPDLGAVSLRRVRDRNRTPAPAAF